jgi:integrase
LRRTCQRAGLTGVRLHDLRHYVATQLLARGVDVRIVAGRLGHRDAATTRNVNAHSVEAADRGTADLLANRLRRSTGTPGPPSPPLLASPASAPIVDVTD